MNLMDLNPGKTVLRIPAMVADNKNYEAIATNNSIQNGVIHRPIRAVDSPSI